MLIVRTRFLILLEAALRVVHPIVKSPTPSPTSGETQSNLHKHVSLLPIDTPEHLQAEVKISLIVGQQEVY
jgi:hypothetical protein